MKQIIKDVLNDMSNSQVNLASDAARETVSSLISAALKAQGYNNSNKVNSYLTSDLSEEEQKARDSWVCSICGKNTFEVDSDYIGSGTNHLGCEIRLEQDENYRKKNWSQKKHEDKVFKHQDWIDKLSEEVVSDNDTNYIYESPDSGKTVYRRKIGSDKKELVKDWKTISGQSKAK